MLPKLFQGEPVGGDQVQVARVIIAKDFRAGVTLRADLREPTGTPANRVLEGLHLVEPAIAAAGHDPCLHKRSSPVSSTMIPT